MPCSAANRSALPGVCDATPRRLAAGTVLNASAWHWAMNPDPTSPIPTSRMGSAYRRGNGQLAIRHNANWYLILLR